MAAHLQQLAEELASRLRRSIAIDDARLHLLAHSPHFGEVDPARAESILRRAVPREVVDHVYSCRDEATGMYVVTPREDLGLRDTRTGCPILQRGSLLGFVWLLGSEGPIDESQLDAARHAATQAATLLHREHLSAASLRDRERQLVGRLLSESTSTDDRNAAAADIRAEALFSTGSYSVITAQIEGRDEEDQLALASGLAVIRSRRLPQDVLELEGPGAVTLVVADQLGPSARDSMLALAASLRDAILAKTDAPGCWVGVSRSRADLADAHRSAEEAIRAAGIARRVPSAVDPVVAVDDLGVYELLDHLPDDALRTMIHPGLMSLMDKGARNDSLVRTLEVFLGNAGDVKTASEQLYAHRTSLYYRLRRIQELTGLNLADGEDRLIAHLGLRIARLTGLWEEGR